MDRMLNKWYFGLIILPVLVNYLTEVVQLPDLFKNWTYTILGILTILIFILVYEIYGLKKENIELKSKPKESDKKIVKTLIDILDIDSFHDKIKKQDSWYGYEKEAISKTIIFAEKAGLISCRTADKKLNELIKKLKESIDDFNGYCSFRLYSSGHYYSPAKGTDFNVQKAESARAIMNKKADVADERLTELMTYLKTKNYLE